MKTKGRGSFIERGPPRPELPLGGALSGQSPMGAGIRITQKACETQIPGPRPGVSDSAGLRQAPKSAFLPTSHLTSMQLVHGPRSESCITEVALLRGGMGSRHSAGSLSFSPFSLRPALSATPSRSVSLLLSLFARRYNVHPVKCAN